MRQTGTPAQAIFAAEVRRDLRLRPKQLQSKYLYDALGSSLFEAICRLPWYRITRAETRLLQGHGDAIVAALSDADPAATLVELGCGSGEKLLLLAEALQARGASARVHLIDVSPQALEQTEQRLNGLRHFSVVGHQSTYEEGLRRAVATRADASPMLVLLLGSNIGNFDTPAAAAFLTRLRGALAPGDLLLLGADLTKPERDLLLAYDDPLGVTAAFNRNLLVRINRELGADFDLGAFAHRVIWNRTHQRIEMHLVSLADQVVRVPASDFVVRFAAGEWIWTESSYKYTPEQIVEMGAGSAFATRDQWIDADARFALTLFVAM
ncbi:MAG TPA: L-histidine N(alpha)-methyltransferase [Vicinamibacterales bacterium]|nr:L-histidine N(alpha)-methyltransferase [Vicinamibacterales bacterium]